jgi:transposase
MNKVKTKKQKTKNVIELPVVNPYSAGIDIGDTLHVVAVAPGLSDERVRSFGTMTSDLRAIADWLAECEIDTIAMESTGVYWKPLFSLLSSKGFEVYLVNAAHAKNITGRKDDENDAMWIQKLHSCGLLSSSYLPDDEQETLRTIVRFRRILTQDSSRCINRIQKSLELMNIKFHTVISDIVGETGQAVLRAIIAGEREAKNFLPLIGYRIKADKDTIVKSLEGNWREEHLYTLRECYSMYLYYRERIAAADKEIEKQLQKMEAKTNEGVIEVKRDRPQENPVIKIKKGKDKNHPKMDVRYYLERIHGTDVLAIYGLSDIGGLELLGETGTDLSKWKTDKKFVGWLNLCPNNKISGGKQISSHVMKKKPNTASQAFKHAANSVQKSDHWLGDYFRRMKTKGGNKYAITATAAKIARIYYKMVTQKEVFKPIELSKYQENYKAKKIAYLERKLALLKQEAA